MRALLAPLVLAAFLSAPAGSASASIVFDLTWGSLGTGDNNFSLPTRVATDSSGNVYVSDTGNHRIQKFNSSGTFITKWGATLLGAPIAGTGDGEFTSPQGIATDSSSNVYVADAGNNRIQKFNSSGGFLTKWGSLGTGTSQFNGPQGIATDSSGNVYVADTGNNRIQKFNSSGTFITTWGSVGTGDGQFSSPSGVATDSSGNVYVADAGNNRIQKFDSSGAFITKWGSVGTGDGQFGTGTNMDLATGFAGNVIVADPGNNRIQKFRPSGAFITTWGSVSPGDFQLNGPSGVAVASSDHVYVVDRADHRIKKFHETDATAPDTQIDSGPSGLTNSASPSFGFSSEAGASFECRLDSSLEADFQTCTSPKPYSSLADGAHTFEVRAVDAAGNPDPSPASRSFTVDTVAPQTQIDSGPSGLTNSASPSFGFSSEAGASFECRLDSSLEADFQTCTSPKPYSSLADGAHTFEVRAVDAAGNPDPSPASRSFTVDTVAPQTQIDSGPSGLTNSASPSFGFSSEAGASFECRLDSSLEADFQTCTSPKPYSSLADGAHTFEVRATDQAGNTDPSPASRGFTVDTVAPQTQIDSGPSGLTNDASPSFGFSSEAGASFECRLDSSLEADFDPCTSPKPYSSLADGAHTFEVRATDQAGNTDPSPASRGFTVDTAAPQTQINSGPSGFTNDPTPTFTVSSSETGSSFECKVDSAPYAPCSSPKTTPHLGDGSHTFSVRSTDPVGNVDPTPASRSFTVRTAAIHVSGTTLVITAAAGAKDNFAITRPSASVVRVTDFPGGAYTGSGVHAWAQCSRTGDFTANCSAAGITLIEVFSGVQTDKVVNSTAIPSSLSGGAANDMLLGGSSNDTFNGGLGADVIKGMNGNDELFARDQTSDTTINCDGGTAAGAADKADLDLLPKDSPATGCETVSRY